MEKEKERKKERKKEILKPVTTRRNGLPLRENRLCMLLLLIRMRVPFTTLSSVTRVAMKTYMYLEGGHIVAGAEPRLHCSLTDCNCVTNVPKVRSQIKVAIFEVTF
jgi:hypothetical protein